MASNLSKAQLLKRDNWETLLKKFFHMRGYMNVFTTTEGRFIPEALVVLLDNRQVTAYEPDQVSDYKEIRKEIENIVTSKKAGDTLKFVGKIENTNRITTIKLADLVKTEEFGGQVGGKKINLGIQFENQFYESLDCYLNCKCKHTRYKEYADAMLAVIGKQEKTGLSNVVAEGGLNKPRPLVYSGGGLRVGTGAKDIGSTITDITTEWGKKKDKVYLSLKHGNTLTFINSGVKQIFLESDYKKEFEGYNNPVGLAIFEAFGIDPKLFAKTFNDYPTFPDGNMPRVVPDKWDRDAIKNLLEYAIGYGYWMVHGDGNKVTYYEMDRYFMEKAANITGGIEIMYGGSMGRGKRVDIHMESSEYKFMWNLRNKQGGQYPSHIMCDYKKK
jgi:hypothetical protein